jgi:hypothetical protein
MTEYAAWLSISCHVARRPYMKQSVAPAQNLLLPCTSMYHSSSLAASTRHTCQSIAAVLQCMGASMSPLSRYTSSAYYKASLKHDYQELTCLVCTLEDLFDSLSHPYQE